MICLPTIIKFFLIQPRRRGLSTYNFSPSAAPIQSEQVGKFCPTAALNYSTLAAVGRHTLGGCLHRTCKSTRRPNFNHLYKTVEVWPNVIDKNLAHDPRVRYHIKNRPRQPIGEKSRGLPHGSPSTSDGFGRIKWDFSSHVQNTQYSVNRLRSWRKKDWSKPVAFMRAWLFRSDINIWRS